MRRRTLPFLCALSAASIVWIACGDATFTGEENGEAGADGAIADGDSRTDGEFIDGNSGTDGEPVDDAAVDPFCDSGIIAQAVTKIYCPVGGGAQRCTITPDSGSTNACCAKPMDASICQNQNSACDEDAGTLWRCARPSDCNVGAVESCCMTIVSDIDAGACIEHVVATNSSCVNGCGGGGNVVLCDTTDDCLTASPGTTCVLVEVTFNQSGGTTVVGACR